MKKVIALLMSCIVMSASVASAATMGNLQHAASGVNKEISTTNDKTLMPCFRAGDTIKFELTGLTAGKSVTLISGLVSANGAYADDNVQYINQYDNVAETATVEYKVRADHEGIYNIKINDGVNEAQTFYYMVADPVFETLSAAGGAANTYYVKSGPFDGSYNLGFVGTVKLGTTDVSLIDAGVMNVGFKISEVGTNAADGVYYGLIENGTATEAQTNFLSGKLDNSVVESTEIIYYYGIEINGVPEASVDKVQAEAVQLTVTGEAYVAPSPVPTPAAE